MTLTIKNVSKRLRNEWALREVSFQVERGEIFGITCIDAETKSVLFDLISGLTRPDEGQIQIDSIDVTSKSKSRRGIYFQTRENSSKFAGLFKRQNNSDSLDVESIVGGFSDALNRAESVLIIESRLVTLNRHAKERKYEELRTDVRKKNLCVLFSTNDFAEVFTVCDRVGIFGGGKLLQIGTPREVYELPNSVAISRATGSNNIFSARRVSSSKSEAPQFITIDGEHQVFTDKISKNDLAPINQNVNLSIRPEHISISFGASFPEDNLLKAEITEICYMGATTLLHLNAGGLNLKALVLRLVGLKVGDECMVGLPPDRIQVLKN